MLKTVSLLVTAILLSAAADAQTLQRITNRLKSGKPTTIHVDGTAIIRTIPRILKVKASKINYKHDTGSTGEAIEPSSGAPRWTVLSGGAVVTFVDGNQQEVVVEARKIEVETILAEVEINAAGEHPWRALATAIENFPQSLRFRINTQSRHYHLTMVYDRRENLIQSDSSDDKTGKSHKSQEKNVSVEDIIRRTELPYEDN